MQRPPLHRLLSHKGKIRIGYFAHRKQKEYTMSNLDGAYDCVTKSPMGDQKSVFTVKVDGDSFTGSNAGPMGSLDVVDGTVSGNTLTWKMNMTVPMPMTLEATATVDGDALTGTIVAGMFGSMAMSGTRQG
jgi:hypothetical protein